MEVSPFALSNPSVDNSKCCTASSTQSVNVELELDDIVADEVDVTVDSDVELVEELVVSVLALVEDVVAVLCDVDDEVVVTVEREVDVLVTVDSDVKLEEELVVSVLALVEDVVAVFCDVDDEVVVAVKDEVVDVVVVLAVSWTSMWLNSNVA